MTLPDYFRVAMRWWWLVVLGSVLFGAAAYGLTERMTPIYRAQATILVNQAQSPGTPTYQDILSSQQLTKTYAELVTSDLNLQRALARLPDAGLSISDLERKVSASAASGTQLVHIFAEDALPERAASIASTVADAFPGYIEQAQLAGSNASSTDRLNSVFVAEPARAPSSPVRPSKATNTALGVILGVVAMAALVAILEYRDDHIDDRSNVQALNLPFLGSVLRAVKPRGAGKRWVPSIVASATHEAIGESYRQIQASLAFSIEAHEAKVILVTSANPGEGKSTTAANLAQALAESSKAVLLIDADLRKPDVHRYFPVPNSSGLSSAFVGDLRMLQGLVKRIGETFYVLPAGPTPPNPAELLASHRMEKILDALKPPFEIVIIDSPPILGLADASLLTALSDGVVLVARKGKTRRGQLREAAEAVLASRRPLLGVVLNGQERRHANSYYQRYGYGTSDAKRSRLTRGLRFFRRTLPARQ